MFVCVCQVDNVQGSLVEVEVTAATRVGEGLPGTARVTLTNTVPAAIYSSSKSLREERGRDVTLPCGHVGQPRPKLTWTYQGRELVGEGRLVKGDGGLVIQEATRQDSGNYTCTVTNKHGSDHITYSLIILGELYSMVSCSCTSTPLFFIIPLHHFYHHYGS